MYKGMNLIAALFTVFFLNAQNNPQLAFNEGITQTNTDNSGITVETKIVIEKEGRQAKIVFWQETQNGFFFKDVDWKGEVTLELDNGDRIQLTEKSMKGHTMHPGAHIGPYFVPDLYQRYTSYYLTDLECQQLKQYPLAKVIYFLDDEFETAEQVIHINDPENAIAKQLMSIGK